MDIRQIMRTRYRSCSSLLAAALFVVVTAFDDADAVITNTWSSYGPSSSVITTLLPSRNSGETTILAGTNGGGIYASTDHGATWSSSSTGLPPNTIVNSLVTNGSSFFVGTNGSGVYISTDQGASWTSANSQLPANSNVTSLAVNGTDIYAGVNGSGVYKSSITAAPLAWTALNGSATKPLGSVNVRSVAALPTTPPTLLAGTTGAGLFLSSDDGATWTSCSDLTGATVPALAFDPSDTSTLYAGTTAQGVFRSINGGSQWLPANSGLPASTTINGLSVLSSQVFAETDKGLFTGNNDGTPVVWGALISGTATPAVNVFVNALAVDPDAATILYAGTRGGIYKRTDSLSNTWAASSSGLSYATDVRTVAIDSSSMNIIYAGGSGSGAFRSNNSGATWTISNSGLGNVVVNTLLQRGTTIYAGTSAGVLKTTNGLASWDSTGLTSLDVRTLAVDTRNSLIFAGTNSGVYRSPEAGISWTLTDTASLRNLDVRSMAIDPSQPETRIYAGTAGGVYSSTDSGDSWSMLNPGFTSTINGLALDPAAVMYAATAAGLYRFSNSTWENVSSSTTSGSGFFDQSDSNVTSVAVASGGGIVVAGTSGGGAYVSSDSGSPGSWQPLKAGLPIRSVQSLAIDSGSPRKVHAGVAGNGAYSLTVSPTVQVNKPEIDYKTVVVGEESLDSITVSNNGPLPLAVKSVTLSGGSSSQFAIKGSMSTCTTAPFTIAPGASCSLAVASSPTTVGTLSETLAITTDDAANNTMTVNLRGTAIILAAAITPVPDPYLYGTTTQITGTASATGSGLLKVEVSTNGGATWTSATTMNGWKTWSYTWTLPADGAYTVMARAVDTSGMYHSSPDCSALSAPFDCVSTTVNNKLPVTTITSPSSSANLSGTSYQITGTAVSNGAGVRVVEVSTDGGVTWRSATPAPTWATWTYDWTITGSGSRVIKTRATDNANRLESPLPTVTVIFDNIAPTSAIAAPVNLAYISGTSYTIRGTAADTGGSGVSSVQVSLDGEGSWLPATGTSTWSYVWSSLPSQGTFTINSRAVDSSGNLQAPATGINVTIDNIPPSSSFSAIPQYVKGTSYIFTMTATDTGSFVQKVQVAINNGAWSDATYSAATGTWTFAWTIPSDGTYTVSSRAIDAAGNIQTTPTTASLSVNNTAPTVVIVAPAEGAALKGSTFSITGIATDSGAGIEKVEVSIDSGAWQPATVDAAKGTWSYAWSFTGGEKVYSLRARATDKEGDVQLTLPVSVSVDNTAPTSVIVTPLSGVMLNGTTFTITGTATDPLAANGTGSGLQGVQVSFDGGTTWVSASSTDDWKTWSFVWVLPDADKQVTIKSRAIDKAGNEQILPYAITVDVYQRPPVSTVTSPADKAHLNGSTATISGTAFDYGLGIKKVEISTDGGTTWNPASGTTNWSYDWQLPVDGTYTILVKATDIVGYVQSSLTSISVTIDRIPPTTTISNKPAYYSAAASGSFILSADEATTFHCKFDDGAYTPCTSPVAYTLADGSHTLTVRSTDLAGNQEQSPPSHAWIIDTIAPQVTAMAPVDKAKAVGVTTPVKITFSEAVDAATVSTATFTLDNGITGTVNYDAASRSATLTAVPRLAYATTYTATITGVKDFSGNPLPAPVVWTFATDPDGDIDLNGAVDVADAVLCLRHILGRQSLTQQQTRHGNVAPLKNGKPNPNDKIDIGDAVVILERVVGLASW